MGHGPAQWRLVAFFSVTHFLHIRGAFGSRWIAMDGSVDCGTKTFTIINAATYINKGSLRNLWPPPQVHMPRQSLTTPVSRPVINAKSYYGQWKKQFSLECVSGDLFLQLESKKVVKNLTWEEQDARLAFSYSLRAEKRRRKSSHRIHLFIMCSLILRSVSEIDGYISEYCWLC